MSDVPANRPRNRAGWDLLRIFVGSLSWIVESQAGPQEDSSKQVRFPQSGPQHKL